VIEHGLVSRLDCEHGNQAEDEEQMETIPDFALDAETSLEAESEVEFRDNNLVTSPNASADDDQNEYLAEPDALILEQKPGPRQCEDTPVEDHQLGVQLARNTSLEPVTPVSRIKVRPSTAQLRQARKKVKKRERLLSRQSILPCRSGAGVRTGRVPNRKGHEWLSSGQGKKKGKGPR
jgi:hypothetical protein